MKQKPRKQRPTASPKLTKAQKLASHKANYNWLDLIKPKPIGGHSAELLELEKQEWWKKFVAGEWRAMRAMFQALEDQKVKIHKTANGELKEIHVADDENGELKIIGSVKTAPPQLLDSPLNIRGWRQRQRVLRQQFSLYIRRNSNVRIITLPYGAVKPNRLKQTFKRFHRRIAKLAGSVWLEKKGLKIILRKTELPAQNAGDPKKECFFLHAHVAVESSKWLGKTAWKQVMKDLQKRTRCRFKAHDAAAIKEEDNGPAYLFKNPLAGHDDGGILTFEALEKLTAKTVKSLFQSLHKQKLVSPMGAFKAIVSAEKQIAKQAGEKLQVQHILAVNHIRRKLVRVKRQKRKKRRTNAKPLQNIIVMARPGADKTHRLLVKNYTNPKALLPKAAIIVNSLQRISSPIPKIKNKTGMVPSAWLIGQVANYVQRLGQRDFITREIEIPRQSRKEMRYDYQLINPALQQIPWIRLIRKGKGERWKWRANPWHRQFPGWNKQAREFDPMSMPAPDRDWFLPIGDKFQPGRYREFKRRSAQRDRALARQKK